MYAKGEGVIEWTLLWINVDYHRRTTDGIPLIVEFNEFVKQFSFWLILQCNYSMFLSKDKVYLVSTIKIGSSETLSISCDFLIFHMIWFSHFTACHKTNGVWIYIQLQTISQFWQFRKVFFLLSLRENSQRCWQKKLHRDTPSRLSS